MRRSIGIGVALLAGALPLTSMAQEGRDVHAGDGGACAGHGQGRASDSGAGGSEDDGLQSRHRAHASRDPLRQ